MGLVRLYSKRFSDSILIQKGGDNLTPVNNEIFSKNLKMFIAKSGKDRKEVASDLGVPYSTVTDWVNGKKYPRIDNLEKIAAYFGISKSNLIEDFEAKQKDNDVLATIIVQLRMNKDLLNVTEKLIKLDKAKLESIKSLLDTFL